MPNFTLALTEHFEIVWWPGKTNGDGLYLSQRQQEKAQSGEDVPESFVELPLVPGLITELRTASGPLTMTANAIAAPIFGLASEPAPLVFNMVIPFPFRVSLPSPSRVPRHPRAA